MSPPLRTTAWAFIDPVLSGNSYDTSASHGCVKVCIADIGPSASVGAAGSISAVSHGRATCASSRSSTRAQTSGVSGVDERHFGRRRASFRRPGRPRKELDIQKLVVALARENPGWGYTKIRDALRGLKIEIGRTTVADMLAAAGIEPAPERNRKRTWKQFLKSHWDTPYACDFFSVEVLGVFGTVRYMVFFVIEVKTRAVHIAGIRIAPDEAWMQQMTRSLLDSVDGFLRNASYLIHDRDPSFTKAWTALLKSSGVKCAPIPAHGPNRNPHAERFVRTIRSECLDHFVIFGERHLRHLIKQFVEHYLMERYHQGIGSKIIKPKTSPSNDNAMLGPIECRSRLGGLPNYYHRKAA